MSIFKATIHSFLFAFAFIFIIATINPAIAQSENAASPADFEQLIDSAKEKGLNVIVISPNDDKDEVVDTGPSIADNILKIRSEISRIIGKAPQAFNIIYERFHALSPDGTLTWLWWAIATAIAGIVIGSGPAYAIRRWNQKYFRGLYNRDPQNRAEKITYLLYRALLILVNVSLMAVVAITVAVIFDSGHQPSRVTIGVIIGAYSAYRIFRHVILIQPYSARYAVSSHDKP